MKKTILCALAAFAVSSCADMPTEAVPADQAATPADVETLAATQAAADGTGGSCEVTLDRDLTTSNAGNLTVTASGIPENAGGWHFQVWFINVSPGWGDTGGLGASPPRAKTFGGESVAVANYAYVIAGVPSWQSYGDHSGFPWVYDAETGKSTVTVSFFKFRTPRKTQVMFWNAPNCPSFQGVIAS